MPLHRLRLLHISDIHMRGTREKEAWRRRQPRYPWITCTTLARMDPSRDLVFNGRTQTESHDKVGRPIL